MREYTTSYHNIRTLVLAVIVTVVLVMIIMILLPYLNIWTCEWSAQGQESDRTQLCMTPVLVSSGHLELVGGSLRWHTPVGYSTPTLVHTWDPVSAPEAPAVSNGRSWTGEMDSGLQKCE